MRQSLRTAGKRLARVIARSPLLWRALGDFLARLGDLLRRSRECAIAEQTALLHSSPIVTDLRVLGGPFRGLRFASGRTFVGTLVPKLVGSYESELVPWLERLRERPYTAIHDIGCAEGYYAVGLAMFFPAARVFAYDSDPDAQEACRTMAALNGVAERVAVRGALVAEDLCRLDAAERALILCDCEGCELNLFTPEVVRHLAGYDLIVELHDFIEPGVSRTLTDRFSVTHRVSGTRTVARDPGRYPVLRTLPALARRIALDELRPGPMEWLLAEARTTA